MVVTQPSDTTNCVTSLQIYVARHTCQHGMCRDNNHSHQADVLVEGWERGQPAVLDITVTSPLIPVSLKESSRIAGVAALSAEMRMHAANDPKC